MELYNVSTRTKDPIDDEEVLHQALLTGTHSFKAGSSVDVMSPDGERGTVPSENVAEAVKAGYRVETPTQKAVREYVDQNKGLSGAAKVGLSQFADEALLGIPELIYKKTANPLDVAKWEALKKEQDLANTVGGVAGFATGMVAGAPIFKGATAAGDAAASAIAAKLGATAAGEEIGKRTISNIAKQIVAKSAGGAVEGSLLAAPQAITETALGDPGDAAETLLAGVGVGSVFGGGGELAKELLKLGVSGVTKGASAISQQKETVEGLVRKAAKVVTGVDEDAIRHYVENSERVNAAPTVEAIKDGVDDVVFKAKERVDMARNLEQQAKQDLDFSYREKARDFAQERAPLRLAEDLQSALNEQKSVLGNLSEQADNALEASGANFKKGDILKFIDNVENSIGVKAKSGETIRVSDEAVSAANKLKAQRSRIEGFGDDISGQELRGILRDVRQDINYNMAAGEFNDTLNKARKAFTNNVSDVLKGSVPEYRQFMERMAPLSETLEQMSKNFGTPEKAVSALNGILSAKGELKSELLTKFSDITGKNWQEELKAFRAAKGQLEEIRRGKDLRPQLLPELTAKLERAREAVKSAEEAYEPVRRLSRDSTQSAIKNQFGKNVSIENRKAFETASEMAGRDFLSDMKDRAVLDAFSKESTQGSRKTNLFSVLGGAIGGLAGGPAGAGIGYGVGGGAGAAMDVYGGRLLKKMIDTNRDVSGLLFSEQAMKRTAEKLDEIPKLLKRMGNYTPESKTVGQRAVIRMLDKHGQSGSSRDQTLDNRIKKLNDLNEKTSSYVANPEALSSRIAALTSGVSSRGAPMIGEALSGKMSQAINYINQSIPKPPKPRNAFSPKVEWRPSDYELSKFEQKLAVVQDPFVVLDELERGTLTRSHMEALQAVYPGLSRMISQKIIESSVDQEKPMSYSQRMKLSLALGQGLDDSTTPQSIAYYQQTFLGEDLTEEKPQDTPGFKANVNIAQGVSTNIDRVANRNV